MEANTLNEASPSSQTNPEVRHFAEPLCFIVCRYRSGSWST